jgi:hypothetical protein
MYSRSSFRPSGLKKLGDKINNCIGKTSEIRWKLLVSLLLDNGAGFPGRPVGLTIWY